MRKVIATYTCDNCRKQEIRERNGNDRDYPFDLGWVRLDSISLGIPIKATHRLIDQPSQFEAEDLDFCSPRCFSERMKQEFSTRGEPVVMGRSGTPVNQGEMEEPQIPQQQIPQPQMRPQQNQQMQQQIPPNYSEQPKFEEIPEPTQKNDKRGWFGKKKK